MRLFMTVGTVAVGALTLVKCGEDEVIEVERYGAIGVEGTF